MSTGVLAAVVHSAGAALALIAVVLFGFQRGIDNVQTLPGDYFPEGAVGSVAGLGGTADPAVIICRNKELRSGRA